MKTYRILSDDELREARICEEYSCLVGPDGFECVLSEPEDRVWWRDLSPVVERLNNYADRIAELEQQLAAAQEREAAYRNALMDAAKDFGRADMGNCCQHVMDELNRIINAAEAADDHK